MLSQFSSAQITEDFLNQLLTDAGMDTVSPELREEMLADLRARLQDRLLGTVIINLSEQDLEGFNKLLDQNANEEQVAKFIDEKVPNATELFATAMLGFRNDYLGLEN